MFSRVHCCLFKSSCESSQLFDHDTTHDPEVTHVFDRNVPLFLDCSSQERVEAIRTVSYKTLWEIITDAKFSVSHEDVSVKLHFLFEDSVPGGIKIGILNYGGSFRQEGLYGTNIMGLRPSFVNEDALVNKVVIVPNTFGNELVKIDA
ncbi:uncharacterized protein A4U43_C01F22220 [Asparagus officinalis]|uniref:Uncharacterized protein n=1 Tax=Asparagus officinalis TaxID=4686 RepID=A0A5P1FRI0_ASPOF|nr:uncharacterized protein A4U43_C01F22220 [Asparagus officinalis]